MHPITRAIVAQNKGMGHAHSIRRNVAMGITEILLIGLFVIIGITILDYILNK